MGTPMIVPVTDTLKHELAATGRVLATVDTSSGADQPKMDRKKLNDRDHFTALVESLEPLVIATLAATSSVPLTAMATPAGARFDMGASTQLAHHVTATVTYLRDTASELLARGGFSQYNAAHAATALGLLKKLNGLLLSGIIKQAEADLDTVKGKGSTPLIAAADRLAKLAAAKVSQDGDPQAAPVPREVREGTWNPAG
jgi:hypothetical protein